MGDFASACFTICEITFFFNFFHEIFRINVNLSFYIILLYCEKFGGQIPTFSRKILEFGRQICYYLEMMFASFLGLNPPPPLSLKSQYPKIDSMYPLEKITQPAVLKLG